MIKIWFDELRKIINLMSSYDNEIIHKCDCNEYISLKHYRKKCPHCNQGDDRDYANWGHWCQCLSQCGCWGFMICRHCKKGVMPKRGEGYCSTVRQIRQDMKGYDRCILPGCKKGIVRRYGNEYCSDKCKKEDGCV